jgi:hypothetical protein
MTTIFLAAMLAQKPPLPEGNGRATMIKVCGTCHAPEAVLGNRNTRQGWAELVDEMIEKGARANPRQRREIIEYLAKNFPMKP